MVWMIGTAVATYSVVKYRWWIVAVYAVAALVLAGSLSATARRRPPAAPPPQPAPDRRLAGVTLALVGILALVVHPYTYLDPTDASRVRVAVAACAFIAAGVLLLGPRRWAPDMALGVAVVGYLGTAAALIHLDPTPKIDVWVTLQQATDAVARGQNIYTQIWVGSPGVQDAFTYLPWTAVLLVPGRLLAGDVRWMLVALTLLTAVAVRLLPGRGAPAALRTSGAAAGALLLLTPGTPTQVEQAWTEPLLLACLVGWALALRRGRTGLAVLSLALGLASKQHLVLLLPLLAAWPGFGWRRTAATAGLAGALVLPWFIASPADMWHDTVSVLVHFQPLLFADTLYIAAIQQLGWTPPFWLTGAVVGSTVAVAATALHRRRPPLAEVLRWFALVLLVANLVNKQAFYNQYWLVAALVLVSWAVPDAANGADTDAVTAPPARPAAAAA
jgi:hypothetical protein